MDWQTRVAPFHGRPNDGMPLLWVLRWAHIVNIASSDFHILQYEHHTLISSLPPSNNHTSSVEINSVFGGIPPPSWAVSSYKIGRAASHGTPECDLVRNSYRWTPGIGYIDGNCDDNKSYDYLPCRLGNTSNSGHTAPCFPTSII